MEIRAADERVTISVSQSAARRNEHHGMLAIGEGCQSCRDGCTFPRLPGQSFALHMMDPIPDGHGQDDGEQPQEPRPGQGGPSGQNGIAISPSSALTGPAPRGDSQCKSEGTGDSGAC
jgi:hypothetical protein